MSGMLCTSYCCASVRLVVDVDLDDLVRALRASPRSARRSDRPGGRVRTTAPRSRRSRAVGLQHLALPLRGGDGPSPGSPAAARAAAPTAAHRCGWRRARRAPAARSRARPRGPSGTRRTRAGLRVRRAPAARSRDRCTGIIGSSVPCCSSTGTSFAASQSTSSARRSVGTNGLMASTPAGCGRSDRPSPSMSASPAPWENPPTTAVDRGNPCSSHVASSRSSSVASASRRPCAASAGSPAMTSNHEKPGGAACGPRGSTVTNLPLGVEVRQQAAEVALVGAVTRGAGGTPAPPRSRAPRSSPATLWSPSSDRVRSEHVVHLGDDAAPQLLVAGDRHLTGVEHRVGIDAATCRGART